MDTVLIAEDDLMVADMLAEILADEGFEVIGIAQRVSEAIAIAQRHTPDLAVIDVQLLDGLGTELANELLHHKEIGILYTTGNKDLVAGARGHACLGKPFSLRDAAISLRFISEILQQNEPTRSPPSGLHLLGVSH